MLARVGRLLAVLLVLGCGRTGLELDQAGATGANSGGTGGSSFPGGTGGVAGTGGTAGGGGFCQVPSFSTNLPNDGALAVSTHAKVSVGFACSSPGAVEPSALSLVLVSPVGTVDGSVAWDPALGRLTFTPARPLALATPYTAIAGASANQLMWSFETIDGEWQPEDDLGAGGDLALAVSPDGHGLVGFHSGAELVVRRFTLQGGVSSHEIVSDGPLVPRSLRVGVADGGAALVVWVPQAPSGPRRVRARRGTVERGWGPAPDIGPQSGPELVEDLALAGDGTGIVLVGVRSSPEGPGVLHSIPVGTDAFGPPGALTESIPLDTVRAVARPGGRSWAVWSSWAATGRVLGRHAASGGAFGAELVMGEPAARAGFVAMSNDDSVFAVWQEGSPPREVRVARFTPAGESEPPVALDTAVPVTGTLSSGIYARIAADGLGRAMALWVNQGETAEGILEEVRAQRFEDGWAAGHDALSGATIGEWAVISPMGLALDRHGNGFAGFGHGSPARAWVRRFRDGSGWAPAVELAPSASAPLVAVDASGRAVAAWAAGGRVYLRRFIELTAPRPRH